MIAYSPLAISGGVFLLNYTLATYYDSCNGGGFVRKIFVYLRNKRGQAMVEMAFAVPILVLLLAGILDMGRVVHDALTINYAAREGARVAAVGADNAAILTAIYNASRSVNLTDTPDISPLTDRKPNQPVTITISHTVPILFPVISALVPNPFPLQATAVMRME